MRKIIAILLALVTLMSVFPASASEEKIWDPQIWVKSISYSKDTLSAGEMDISCTLRKLNIKDGIDVPFSFITVVKKGGIIYDIKEEKDILSGDNEEDYSVTVTIPGETAGTIVESYFLSSLAEGKTLAPKATFGTKDNGIYGAYADGKRVDFNPENEETQVVFPASFAHLPDFVVIPKNSAATVVTNEIKKVEQVVMARVTAAGETLKHRFNLSVAEGSVTDAYMLKSSGTQPVKTNITVDEIRNPEYGFKADGVTPITPEDEGFSYINNLPIIKTLCYTDRNQYYTAIPHSLIGATAVQTNLNILRYDELYNNKDTSFEKFGAFTIDRSAEVILFGGGGLDWVKKEGYKAKPEYDLFVIYESETPYATKAYARKVIVPEGKTEEIMIGGNMTAGGSKANNYFFAVRFLSPEEIFAVTDISVEGSEDFYFDADTYEYTVVLDEGTTTVPEVRIETVGVGVKVNITEATEIPGATVINVKSGDGTASLTYTLNFRIFETALDSLQVGEEEIEGFDKETLEYVYKLPYGWKAEDGIPVVTPVANSFLTAETVQATPETMEATVTVTSKKGAVKVYKVKFEETLERTSTLQKDNTAASLRYGGVLSDFRFVKTSTDRLYSMADSAELSSSFVLTACGNTNDEKSTIGSWTVNPSVLLMKLNLEKMTDVDISKPVTVYAYGKQSNGDVQEYKLKIFDATGTELSDVDSADSLRNMELWKSKPEILTRTVTKGEKDMEIEITDFIRTCLENNITDPVIGFYVYPEGGSGIQRVYFNLDMSYTGRSQIRYYKFD